MSEFIRLPCGHLKQAPERAVSVVACRHPGCEATWRVSKTSGEWTARREEAKA